MISSMAVDDIILNSARKEKYSILTLNSVYVIILNIFSIALCDDDPVIHRIVLQNIESFYKSKNISVNIQSYYLA